MTITEALKISSNIRRKSSPKHKGSSGKGWVDAYYLTSCCINSVGCFGNPCCNIHLTVEDLLADDWQAKPIKSKK